MKNELKMEYKKQTIEQNKEKNNNKKFTICGFTITKLFAYFIIYSILGYIVETLFGLVTKGVIESRQSFLYGPFCAIYGIGAVIMILGLQKFTKNNYTLFLGGFIIGSVIEYLISLIGELVFNIKWWDYSNMAFNINGRICIAFSFFWGILAIYLIVHLNPKIDKLLDKIPQKILKITVIIFIIIMLIDFLITGFALKMFFTRLVRDYNLELDNLDNIILECTQLYENPTISKITYKFFSDEKMLKTFPNIKLTGKDGNIIFVSDILKHIQPYYFRLFTPAY